MILDLAALPPIADEPCVVADTEVSASGPDGALIDLAIVGLRTGQVWCDQLFRPLPGAAWSPYAARVHGIAPGRLRGQPLVQAVAPQLRAMLAGRIVIGHNIASDAAVLTRELGAAPWLRTICTLRVAQRAMLLPSYRLADLAVALKLPVGATHRALADTQLTRRVYLALRDYIHQEQAR